MNFKTRFFNSISVEPGNSSVLRKTSTDTKKLLDEYEYWYSLPESLKPYFVQPYDYEEDQGISSYLMTRYEFSSAGEQLAYGQMSIDSFSKLLEKVEEFRSMCPAVEVPGDYLVTNRSELILNKTKSRLKELQSSSWSMSMYANRLKRIGADPETLYADLKNSVKEMPIGRILLSHGDLTLSNILWNYESEEIKLVDPKGKSYMYLDEYYDISKLSQSILGRYEEIIYGKYLVDFDTMDIVFERPPKTEYQQVFLQYLQEIGLNEKLVKVYQASLFLSMLPMHLEDHQRVAAFLVSCRKTLDSID